MPDSSYQDNEACFFLSISNSAEHESKVDTARLLQLVLGIAINCDRKDSKTNPLMCDSCKVSYDCGVSVQPTSRPLCPCNRKYNMW